MEDRSWKLGEQIHESSELGDGRSERDSHCEPACKIGDDTGKSFLATNFYLLSANYDYDI